MLLTLKKTIISGNLSSQYQSGDPMHMNPLLRIIVIITVLMAALSLFREGKSLALLDMLWER